MYNTYDVAYKYLKSYKYPCWGISYLSFYLKGDYDTAIEAGNQDHSDPAFGGFNIGYYGDANNPREATGYLYYEESRGYNQAGISKDDFINQCINR